MKKQFHFIFLLFLGACSEPELVLDNEYDEENPDYIAPETIIISTDPIIQDNKIISDELTVVWEGNEENMEFQYSLDNRPWSDWSSLPTATFRYLDDTLHTILVKGRYESGTEEDFPDTLEFEVDAIDGTSLRMNKLYTTVSNQNTFKIDVVAEEAELLAGCGILIEYNSDALELLGEGEGMDVGEFFERNNGSVLAFDTTITSAGTTTLFLDIGMYGGNPDYVSGTGTIASLYFLAKLPGEYDIEFDEENTSLRKANNQEIEINTLKKGIVSIE